MYQIKPSETFRRDLEKLLKGHYRKDRRGGQELTKLLDEIIQDLARDPHSRQSWPEPWPKDISQPEGWEFRKLTFGMPRLRGASGQGRLMYLIDGFEKHLILSRIYTHEEYQGRPPDKELSQLIKEFVETQKPRQDKGSSP